MNINGYEALPFQIADVDSLFGAASLVDLPASNCDFFYFSEQEDKEMFKVFSTDEEQRKIFGVMLRAYYPILRIVDGQRVFRYFTPEMIEQCMLSASKSGKLNSIDMHHDGQKIDGVYLLQSYILAQDTDDVAAGSWVAEYKVENDEVWGRIKSGELRGFSPSLPGLMLNEQKDNDMLKGLKQKIDKLFNKQFQTINFGDVTISSLNFSVGDEAFCECEDGCLCPPPDGEYTNNGNKYTITNGKITEFMADEVKDPEVEVVEESTPEKCPPPVNLSQEAFDALMARIDAISARMDAITPKPEVDEVQLSDVPFVKESDIKKEPGAPIAREWTKTQV